MSIIDPQIISFVLVTIVLTITPGVDTFIVMRNVLRGGKKDGMYTSLGICTGLFFHATLSVLGITIILLKYGFLLKSIKIAGALYLVWLGTMSILHALKQNKPDNLIEKHQTQKALSPLNSFREGLLSNLLNPKPAIFYMAFLPQFIAPTDPIFIKTFALTLLQFAIGISWLTTLSLLFFRVGKYAKSTLINRALNIISGSVLITFGLKLGLEGE